MDGFLMLEYDKIMKLSVLEAIREILRITAAGGLIPEENQFYISFATDFPGVVIPNFLKEKYPKEMTILLQNAFQNLIVEEGSLETAKFSVDLKFSGITATITVPFKAIKSFRDPLTYFFMSLDFMPPSDNADTSDKTENGGKAKDEKTDGVVIDFNSFKKK